jgi:hypothetical protein
MTEGTLVVSTNRGRYAVGDAETGADLTSGDRIAVWLGGQWVDGSVESGARLSTEVVPPGHPTRGYYFISDVGGVCGLCVGMKVRM